MSEKINISYWMYGAQEHLPLGVGWKKIGKRFNTLIEAKNAIRMTVINKRILGWAALKIQKHIFIGEKDAMKANSITVWMDVYFIERDGQTIYFV